MQRTLLANLAIAEVKGVGAKTAELLAKLGIVSVQDLLFHLPLRYEDRTRICPIADAWPAQQVSVQGVVVSSDITFGKRRSWVVVLQDGRVTALGRCEDVLEPTLIQRVWGVACHRLQGAPVPIRVEPNWALSLRRQWNWTARSACRWWAPT